MHHQPTFRTPRRELLGIPNDITGKGVKVVLTDSFFPAHSDVSSGANRSIQWLDAQGKPFDPVPLTQANPTKGQHGLACAAVCGGTGLCSDGQFGGVAPQSDMVLVNDGILDGQFLQTPEENQHLEFLSNHAKEMDVRVVLFGSAGARTGPLTPWQWDTQRRYCEWMSDQGILVVSPTGNCPGSFSPTSLAPSALAGGGLLLPTDPSQPIRPFHSPEGVTFENKCLPDHLAPAEPVIVPALDSELDYGMEGVPPGHTTEEGTSFSGPFIVGLVACVWQKYPHITGVQMRAVIQKAAKIAELKFNQTRVGMPTWPLIEEAIDTLDELPQAEPSPFDLYTEIQQLPWDVRVRYCFDTPDKSADVLLNSLPDRAPSEVVTELALLFRSTKDPRVRAAIVLLLSPEPRDKKASHPLLSEALQDESSLVLGCMLDVMRRYPNLLDSREEDIIRLMNHSDGPVRCEALFVAEAKPCRAYIHPLIQGMKRDLNQGPLFAFFLRRRCLKAITGESYWPETRKMLPGECIYSDYWLGKQRESMERWLSSSYAQ